MKRIHLLAASTALIATPAMAHNPWIKPTATNVSGEEGWVGFDAAMSTDVFTADHAPMRLEGMKAQAPDGTEAKIENGAVQRYRSTFDLHLTKVGTYRVGTQSGGITGSYKLNGQEFRVGGRGPGGPRPGGAGGPGAGGMGGGQRAAAAPAGAPQAAGAPAGAPGGPQGGPGRFGNAQFVPGGPDFVAPAGATDVNLTETGSRYDVFVTLGKPSEVKLTGKGLEMQPITHPADLVADEAGKFRFLVDGKPAAGLEVEVIPDGKRFRNEQGTIAVRTDAKGEATIPWKGAGAYWLHTAFDDKTSSRPGVSGRRFQYSATLEVAPS